MNAKELAGFRRTARLVVLVLLIAGTIAAWRWRSVFDPAEAAAIIGQYSLAPAVFLALHTLASLVLIPRTLLALVAGILFGMGWGIVWAALGSLAGAAAGFLLARYINSGVVDLERVARLRPIFRRVERGGWRAVALIRLIPVLPHSVGNYGLALTQLPFMAYAFGSLIGQLPLTIAYVELGAAGERWLIGKSSWIEPTLIGLAVLSLSMLVPAYSRWRAR
jgi:uncharacterized membrane protein YdjX (TVP38/TMEM64 family)